MAAFNVVVLGLNSFPSAASIFNNNKQPHNYYNKNNILKRFQRPSGGGKLVRRKQSLLSIKCIGSTPSVQAPADDSPTVPVVPIDNNTIKRDDFPKHFYFGASTSAIQSEGNLTVDGRGPTTWDDMVLTDQGYNADNSYYMWKDDVQALKDMKMNIYRFSISWTRILPSGSGQINQAGIDYYNTFINYLTDNGITPLVTLFHYDVPSYLQESYYSIYSPQFIADFTNYADICFKNFGDRVKYWTTFNEPYNVASFLWQPGTPTSMIPGGAYIAGKNLLIAHATVVRLSKTNYPEQGAEFGMDFQLTWPEPYDSNKDVNTVEAARQFVFDWFTGPCINGAYPPLMVEKLGDLLPAFTSEEWELVKGTLDWVGINYYSATYVTVADYWENDSLNGPIHVVYIKDDSCNSDNVCMSSLGYPEGLYKWLVYIKDTYGSPKIFITENGYAVSQTFTQSLPDALHSGHVSDISTALLDKERLYFLMTHLQAVAQAISEGVDVRGYVVWSLLDGMEPAQGYTTRMGLYFTDYLNNFKRSPKASGKWFSKFLNPALSSVAYTPETP